MELSITAYLIVITDIHTLFISLLAIVFSAGYIGYQAFRRHNTESDTRDERNRIAEWLREDQDNNKLRIILADYEAGNEEVRRRDNVTLLVGTILITSSFLILGSAATVTSQPMSVFSMASIGLFLIWLLALHETGKVTNGITYNHLKSIEGGLTDRFQGQNQTTHYEFGTHLLVCNRTNDQAAGWLKFRRMFWGIVLLLLSFSWLLLSIRITAV